MVYIGWFGWKKSPIRAAPTSQRTRHCAFHGSARSTVFSRKTTDDVSHEMFRMKGTGPYFWPYFVGIFPEIWAWKIGLIYGRYLEFMFLKFPLTCGKIPIVPLSNSGRYGLDRQNTMVGYNHNGTTSARIVGWRDPNIKSIIEPANPAMNFGWQPMLINYWSWEQDSQSWA